MFDQTFISITSLISVTKDLVISRRGYFNEPRNVAIYLIRHLRGDKLYPENAVW